MRLLNVGVIGCGTIAGTHLDAIKKSEHANLYMVTDIIEERAKTISEKYHCQYTSNLNDLLNNNEIDVIHVLTPHYNHFELAKSVLTSNIHCLLEKPMAISTIDAKALIKLTDEKPQVKLGIVFQNRLNNTSQYVKKIIIDKTYGSLLGIRASVTWNRGKDYYVHDTWRGKWNTEGGGVLINQAIHTLDLLQWFGGEINDISGSYGTYQLDEYIEVEDTAIMFINFKNNVKGMLFATNNNIVNSPIEMELTFEEGVVHMQDGKAYFKQDDIKILLCEDNLASGEKAYWGLGHEMVINNFYKSIINNTNNYIDARSGAQTIEVLEKFYQFANKMKKINIDNTREW